MVQVDPADPAFEDPTKFVGPVYAKDRGRRRCTPTRAGSFKQDGDSWRRVVPSPEPRHIFEIRPIRWLLEHDVVIICAGGGGVPTMFSPSDERDPRRCRSRHRQGLRQRAAGPRGRSRPLRDGDRRRRRLRRLGHAAAAGARPGDGRRAATSRASRPGRWGRRSRRRAASSRRPAGAPRSARSTRSQQIVDGDAGTQVVPVSRRRTEEDDRRSESTRRWAGCAR